MLETLADNALKIENKQFLRDVLMGLSLPQKAIPARYFYDHRGSELFEEITDLPEYYPTRTEVALVESIGDELVDALPDELALIEFGAGSLAKVGLLLDRLRVSHYIPIDISGDFLRESAQRISERYDTLDVMPVEADFSHHVELPPMVAQKEKLGFFPGSTIGNLVPREAVNLLRRMRTSLGTGSHLLIGMDRIKPIETLIAAYDDASGTTAAFNLNLLSRINRELGGTIDLSAFAHEARWNAKASRIEMHLVALKPVLFTIAGRSFEMAEGETIHTENSHKYDEVSASVLLRAGGWWPTKVWTDEHKQFLLILAEASAEHVAP